MLSIRLLTTLFTFEQKEKRGYKLLIGCEVMISIEWGILLFNCAFLALHLALRKVMPKIIKSTEN